MAHRGPANDSHTAEAPAASSPGDLRDRAAPGPSRETCLRLPHLIRTQDLVRVRLLLNGPLELTKGIHDCLERIVRRTPDALCRRTAAEHLLKLQDLTNKPDEEERLHRLILATEGTRGDATWIRSAVNLAQVFRTTGRTFECLVLARHVTELAGESHRGVARAAAHLHIVGTLAAFGDKARLGPALDAFEEALDAATLTGRDRILRCMALSFRADYLAMSSQFEAALNLADRHERIQRTLPQYQKELAELEVHRAGWLLQLDRVAEAGEALARAREHGLERHSFQVMQSTVETRHALAAHGQAAAVRAAQRALDLLQPGTLGLGDGVRIEYGAILGRLLMDECDAFAEGRRAFDMAASAMLSRIREIDGALENLPAGAMPTKEDFAILADFRTRFTGEQRDLFAVVATRLRSGVDHACDLLVAEDMIAVCAWCQCVRSAQSGAWLPIGHYVPPGDQFDLTHGMCPTCAESAFN